MTAVNDAVYYGSWQTCSVVVVVDGGSDTRFFRGAATPPTATVNVTDNDVVGCGLTVNTTTAFEGSSILVRLALGSQPLDVVTVTVSMAETAASASATGAMTGFVPPVVGFLNSTLTSTGAGATGVQRVWVVTVRPSEWGTAVGISIVTGADYIAGAVGLSGFIRSVECMC